MWPVYQSLAEEVRTVDWEAHDQSEWRGRSEAPRLLLTSPPRVGFSCHRELRFAATSGHREGSRPGLLGPWFDSPPSSKEI